MAKQSEAVALAERLSDQGSAVFVRAVYDFTRRWGPSDPAEAAEFSAGLAMLIHRIWLDTSTPDKKTLEGLMNILAKNPLLPALNV